MRGAAPAHILAEGAINEGVHPIAAIAHISIFASCLVASTVVKAATDLLRFCMGGRVLINQLAYGRPGGWIREPSKDRTVRIVGAVCCSVVILQAERAASY